MYCDGMVVAVGLASRMSEISLERELNSYEGC
jgi:hypothetical protein